MRRTPGAHCSWGDAEEELEWHCRAGGATRTAVDEVRSRGERLGPERVLGTAMDEEGAHAVVQSMKDPLGLPFMLGCVRAGEAELRAMVGEECP